MESVFLRTNVQHVETVPMALTATVNVDSVLRAARATGRRENVRQDVRVDGRDHGVIKMFEAEQESPCRSEERGGFGKRRDDPRNT
ncbi:hypothetical protein BaRGS_00024464 [Batillaria attramentaria]|uniref:Uncharacterized protein n=1 Tax=Batillaria attramentaria TaxID=370345 RepID=A0ABD0KB81_9CAEN